MNGNAQKCRLFQRSQLFWYRADLRMMALFAREEGDGWSLFLRIWLRFLRPVATKAT